MLLSREPSILTKGSTGILPSNISPTSFMIRKDTCVKPEHYKSRILWEGCVGRYTFAIMSLPWSLYWQTLVILTIIMKYIVHLLFAYEVSTFIAALYVVMWLCEMVFMVDVLIQILHRFWPLVRLYLRVYKRNGFFLLLDVISLIPLSHIFKGIEGMEVAVNIGRWTSISRVYRTVIYFLFLNKSVSTYRTCVLVLEHVVTSLLVLHAGTCVWYFYFLPSSNVKWHNSLGYPGHVGAEQLQFNSYRSCWYYCACRLLNTILGDSYPVTNNEKWLTTVLTLVGYVVLRYWFIGVLAWQSIVKHSRHITFVDKYHHMVSYLKNRGAPTWLIEQAKNYKQTLWNIKDGVLTSDGALEKLPRALRTELIYDINVGLFHNIIIFRDTGEAFLRQVCVLMRHEVYLPGQCVWAQGVVRAGLFCVKRGVIEMLSDEDDESPVIAFKEGTVLGEICLFYSIGAKVTVKAATYVEIQALHRTDFLRAMAEQPLILRKIRSKIEQRLVASQRRQNAILEFDKHDSRLIRKRYRPMKVLKENLEGVTQEDPTFVDDSYRYYKDENNVRQPRFTSDYLELYRLSEKMTTIDAPRICLKSNFPWILEPDTDFAALRDLTFGSPEAKARIQSRYAACFSTIASAHSRLNQDRGILCTNIHLFDAIHFMLVIGVCILSPFKAILSTGLTNLERVWSVSFVAGLLLNIYIQLTTAIVKKDRIIDTVAEITKIKMSSVGFYLDILSVFPVAIFTDTLDPYGETAAGQVALLFPMLQVWHIWNYMTKWEKKFNSNIKFVCLMKFCLIIIIFCYWSGCFLYLYACPRKLCREISWMSQQVYKETKLLMTNKAKHEEPVTSSLLFGTSVFTGSGSSDLAPGVKDLLLVVVFIVIGTYFSCFYTAKVCAIYMLSTERRLKFKESMRELFYFLSVNRVSGKIKARVKKFFCVQWYYNLAVTSDELFKDLSGNIQQEVLAIEMVDTLANCPLFQECSRDFLQTVAGKARVMVLPDGETVQHAADIGRDMYILQKGHCNCINHLGKVVSSIGPGSHFGVIEMLIGLPKVYTVLTVTNCILLHLEYTSLVQCWSIFPEDNLPIVEALHDVELQNWIQLYKTAKPLTLKLDTKINRIAQELKESFVVISGAQDRAHYVKVFDKLGIMRFLRCLVLPVSITPYGIFLKFWCMLRFLVAILYIFSVPYNIATKPQSYSSSVNWIDIFLYIDIIVMSYVGYYNEKSLLITHPLLTITYYLKGRFILDFITVFPTELLLRIINDRINLDLFRVNKLLQVTRIMGSFSYWESDIMRVNEAVVLFKFLPLIFALVNFVTSFIFINSCDSFLPEESFFVYANCTKALIVQGSKYEVKYAIIQYINTFFWVFETFLGCGCATMVVSNNADMWFTMALQISGFLYFAFMFGYVASTRTASANALLEHTEKTKDLANFLYQQNVEPVLTAKSLKYFEYVWKRTNGSNAQQICRRLHSALMEDTLVYMYEHTLREVPLFGKVERSFIRVITQHLHEMYFLKGETVIQHQDIQPYIYIIYRGKVDVLTSYNEMITCMGPGGMFGNFTGQPISCSDVAIYASRNLDLLVIDSQTFFNLVKCYPKIQEPLSKAFETSKDYILPISMDMFVDEIPSDESDYEAQSMESGVDSKSGSSRYDMHGQVSMRSSHSTLSQTKSSVSTTTYQSFVLLNIFTPGTWMFQSFGYATCLIATANYVLILYEFITLNDCRIIYWVQSVFDIIFYINMYFNMHQVYTNRRGDFVIEPHKCRKHYFKHKLQLWSDIFVNFPLEALGFCFPKPVRAMHYFRINKLFRLKYLIEFYKKTSAELTNDLTTLQCAMTFFVVILLIHTFTCIWLMLLMAISPISIIRTLKINTMNQDMQQTRWDFTTSLYVVVSTLTATGCDEFVIDDIAAMAVLSICLVCGKILASIVVATSMQVAFSRKYGISLYEKVNRELEDYLKNQGLSSYQLKKFWTYTQQLWITEHGRQLPALLDETPYVRRCDLMSAMFGQYLRNCYMFADTGEQFLRQLAAVLEYTIFFPGNYIVVAGDNEARMYWVVSGTVSVVSVRSDLTETTHEVLGPGDEFGMLQGLHRGIAHFFSYRAETKVSILTLSLDSWVEIRKFFPEAHKRITQISESLFTKI